MPIDDNGARPSSPERREVEAREHPTATVAGRGGNTGIVLASLIALLLVAGAVYYFSAYRPGTEVATGSSAKNSPETREVTTKPGPTGGAVDTAASPQTTAPQQPSATAGSSPQSQTAPASSAEQATRASPAETRQSATSNAPPKPSEDAAESPASSANQPGFVTKAPGSSTQESLRERPAALPDQPAAAAPPTEIILVVKRGPANIRSAPARTGRVIGTAAKDTQVKEVSRSGSWVEVQTDAGRGWIDAGLVAPLSSQSR